VRQPPKDSKPSHKLPADQVAQYREVFEIFVRQPFYSTFNSQESRELQQLRVLHDDSS
jgi:hypothetical protein